MALNNIFLDIGIIIIIATGMAAIASILKQPTILAYVLSGLAIGPVMGLVGNNDLIIQLSELGIAFLLFLVGLEMDVRKIGSIGIPAAITGVGQVLISSVVGFLILIVLGFSNVESLYMAIALSFSSTMIVVKLLSDKQELYTLHGRMLIGILIVQDVIAIFVLALLGNLGQFSSLTIAASLAKGIALFAVSFLAGKYLLPFAFKTIAKSQELLFMASISWCFILSIFAASLGYSMAIGAFLAGVSLASLKYSIEIFSKVRSLRDFFAILFFVSLGMQMTATTQQVTVGILLSAIVIIMNPLMAIIILSIMGHNKKVSFLSGIGLAQISEFSLIMIAMGYSLGHIGKDSLSIISFVALITITATSYLIKYGNQLYGLFSGILTPFNAISGRRIETENMPENFRPEIILCGQNRIGYSIYNKLKKDKRKFLVVDYNPDVIRSLAKEEIPCIYGDIGDLEVVERLQLNDIQLLISTVPDFKANSLLLKKLREKNKRAISILTSDQVEDALALYQEGADYVIMPHFLGGDHASSLLDNFRDLNSIIQTRIEHIKELHKRKNIGHEHPR